MIRSSGTNALDLTDNGRFFADVLFRLCRSVFGNRASSGGFRKEDRQPNQYPEKNSRHRSSDAEQKFLSCRASSWQGSRKGIGERTRLAGSFRRLAETPLELLMRKKCAIAPRLRGAASFTGSELNSLRQ